MMKSILFLVLENVATQSLPAPSLDFNAPVRRLLPPVRPYAPTPLRPLNQRHIAAEEAAQAQRLAQHHAAEEAYAVEVAAERHMVERYKDGGLRPRRAPGRSRLPSHVQKEEAHAVQIASGDQEATTRLREQAMTHMKQPDGADARARRTRTIAEDGATLRQELRAAEIEEIGQQAQKRRRATWSEPESPLAPPTRVFEEMEVIENEFIRLSRRDVLSPALDAEMNKLLSKLNEYYGADNQRAANTVLRGIEFTDHAAIVEMAENADYWSLRMGEMGVEMGVPADAGGALVMKAVGAVSNFAENANLRLRGGRPIPDEMRTHEAFLRDMIPARGVLTQNQQRAANELKDLMYLKFMHHPH